MKKFSFKSLMAGVLALAMVVTAMPTGMLTAKAAESDTEPVYILYDANRGEHYLTADESEKNGLLAIGWTEGNVAWTAPKKSNTPVYVLYNPNNGGDHYYTSNAGEKDGLLAQGWTEGNVKFYSDDAKGVLVYTLYNPNEVVRNHHYTKDEGEKNGLVAIGWQDHTNTATAIYGVKESDEVKVSSLKATGSKELTATLSQKPADEVTTKDIVVKKGNVTLTPADMTVDGTTVKITLGSKIVKDTYSVAYRETTPATVETEDEKLVEFKTVGTAFSQLTDAEVDAALGAGTVDGGAPDATTVNAAIAYQAYNQYGESISAEVLQVSNTFGGKTFFTEPTSKKPGTILVYDIAAALGITGTKGNLIVVSKNGVSNTCEVVMSEGAKVKSISLKGIYNVASGAYVDAIPAQKAADNYVLVIDAKDQYGLPISKTGLYQTVSVAQMLTNVTVDGISGAGKLTVDSFTTVEINGVEETALKLKTSDGAVAKAGTVKVIVVGDRFGSVMDETIKIEQIDLIKSFTFSAKDTVYNRYENEMNFEATSVAGKNVTDYDTLKKLVAITSDNGAFTWKKQTDGSAKLYYTPSVAEGASDVLDATNTNLKQNTVTSATATVNATISAADQIVVPKTFTVYEKKVPYSIVKYTGDVVARGATINIERAKLVIEDQYGNTMTSADTTLANASIDYKYAGSGVNVVADTPYTDTNNANISNGTFTISPTPTKLWMAISPYARDTAATLATFNTDKAQLTLSLQRVDATKVTNLKAVWNKGIPVTNIDVDGDGANPEDDDKYYMPAEMKEIGKPNQATSGVLASDFKVTGTVNGKTITLNPGTDYTIKSDTYVPITEAEFETAVKKATVTMTVRVTDDEGNQSTQEVSCDYKYSGAASKIAGITSVAELQGGTSQAYTVAATGNITTAELGKLFAVYDQYGTAYTPAAVAQPAAPTFEISLGDKTGAWRVVDNNMKTCEIVDAASTADADFTVTATLANGQSSVVKVVADATAGVATLKAGAEAKLFAVYNANNGVTFNTTVKYNTLVDAIADAESAVAAYVAAGGTTADLDNTGAYEDYAQLATGKAAKRTIDDAVAADVASTDANRTVASITTTNDTFANNKIAIKTGVLGATGITADGYVVSGKAKTVGGDKKSAVFTLTYCNGSTVDVTVTELTNAVTDLAVDQDFM